VAHCDRHRLRLVANDAALGDVSVLDLFRETFFDCTFTSAAVNVVLP